MKPKRYILIIDDEPQDQQKRVLETRLKSSFDVVCETIRTKDIEFKKVKNVEEVLDLDKLKSRIEELFGKYSYDLVLADYNLSEKTVDGLDVVEFIKVRWLRTDVIMYSGKLSDIVRNMIKVGEGEKLSDEQVIEAVSKLVKYRIVAFPERTKYVDEACTFLTQNKELSLTNELVRLLRQHSDLEFKSCFPEFAGMTFGKIAGLIDNNADQRSDEWIKSILEQTIAYLVKVNNE